MNPAGSKLQVADERVFQDVLDVVEYPGDVEGLCIEDAAENYKKEKGGDQGSGTGDR